MNQTRRRLIIAWVFVLALPLTFNACGQGFSASSVLKTKISATGEKSQVVLSWTANRESAVNAAGGGYRVYYSNSSDVSLSSDSIEVPFESGTLAPTSVGLTGLTSGTHYARVQAFSARNPNGSPLSSIIEFTVQ